MDLGDTLDGPLQLREAYDLFRKAPLAAAIGGNGERKSLGDDVLDRWRREKPPTAMIDGEVFLCHGTPASDTTYLLEDVGTGVPLLRSEEEILRLLNGVEQPVVLCGHTHIPRIVLLSNGQLIVNPGSVGLPAYDDELPVKHCMETGAPHASYAILENAGGGWNVSLRRVTYDWAAATRQAKLAGRDDWARGLATGRMRG